MSDWCISVVDLITKMINFQFHIERIMTQKYCEKKQMLMPNQTLTNSYSIFVRSSHLLKVQVKNNISLNSMGHFSVIFLSMVVCLSFQRHSSHHSSQQQLRIPSLDQNFYCSSYLTKRPPGYFTWNDEVCGLPISGLPVTYKNPRQACNTAQVQSFKARSCQQHLVQCTKRFREKHCKDIISQPSMKGCSFEKGYVPRNITTKECCIGDSFISWLDGPCPVPHHVSCKVWPKDQKCGDYEENACGIEEGGIRRNYKNPCTACKDAKVREYYFGDCVDQ